MDRPVSKEYKRKIVTRQVSVLIAVVVVLALLVIFLKSVFVPGVSLSKVSAAPVEPGNIQITVQGSGTVIPAYEEIITSPFRSSIVRIIRKPGDKVRPGDTLLILDNKLAVNDLDMLKNELDLENVRIDKLRIDLQQLKEDYEFSKKIKDIKIENTRLSFEAESELNKLGGNSAFDVKKARTEWEIGKLEASQAEYNFNNQVNARNNGIRELEMEINIQKNKIIKAKDLVDKAYVKAPFSGDLSWIIDQPGASVSDGQQVARLADFSGYKLKGNISNSWSGRVMAGQKVEVRNQGKTITGVIENIMPAVSQGMMECLIRIDSCDISTLRPAQQLEIRVIVSFKDKVLRLPNGPYYKDRGYKFMYVVRGNRAYRTKVLLGDSNFDYVEVLDGLKEGDNVILTDIENKYTRDEIKVHK
ncbi:MAG TPA: HlyD family efflux transporter periplasmic adaptor subunit [Bacteroidales bacterium]|nr:HlyD family efflux transporter periplasmic adaptor subunit [Bacteroidales bacterium]